MYFAVTTNLGSAGFVSVSSTAGLSLPFGYSRYSGSSIAFTGSQDAVNAALATLSVGATDSTTSVQVQMTAFDNGNGLAYNPANSHFYKFVPGKITGTAAFAAVASTKELGLTGYLASITSADENEFVSGKIQDSAGGAVSNVWIGAQDTDVEGDWKWKGGPDDGVQFWKGCNVANGGGPFEGRYSSWADGEPNNWGSGNNPCPANPVTPENCAVTNKFIPAGLSGAGFFPGKWNDISCGSDTIQGQSISGYIAEYGNKPAGGDFSGVDFVNSNMTVAVPATKPTFLDTLFNLIGFNKKTLSKSFKLTVKKPKTKKAPAKTITCPRVKRLRFSYTLLFTEAGRYSFYFTNSKGKRIPMECGTKIKDRVITGPISAPVIQSVKDNEKPVITAYLDVAAARDAADYPLLNVILKRKDGTLVRQDQPNPPLAGTPIR